MPKVGLKTSQGRSVRRCRGVSSAAFGSLRGRFSSLLPVFLRKSPLESLSTSGGEDMCVKEDRGQ